MEITTGELTLTCQHCGESFTYIKTRGPRRMYCSTQCRSAASWTGKVDIGELTLTCQQCGEVFTYTKTSGRRRRYCSAQCMRVSPAVAPRKVDIREQTLDCQHCGESFTHVKTSGVWRKYCSERCKANAGAVRSKAKRPQRRCACGSSEVPSVGRPVCPDCRKDGRNRKGYNRTRRLAMYGLTQTGYDELLTLQHGRCGICATTDPGQRGWFIDHDHACCPGIGSCGDCVRGLLCVDCNLVIGYAKDDIAILARAAEYLARK